MHEGSSAHRRKGSRDNQKHADAIIVMGRAGGGRLGGCADGLIQGGCVEKSGVKKQNTGRIISRRLDDPEEAVS